MSTRWRWSGLADMPAELLLEVMQTRQDVFILEQRCLYPDIDGLDDDADRKADEPMNFTFKFEVQPRVELGKYRGLKIERLIGLNSG